MIIIHNFVYYGTKFKSYSEYLTYNITLNCQKSWYYVWKHHKLYLMDDLLKQIQGYSMAD